MEQPPRLSTTLDRGRYIGTTHKGVLRQLLEEKGASSQIVEGFIAVVVDKDDYVVTSKLISLGGPRTVMVSIRDTFREACAHEKWSKLIVAHNHPDGNPNPSQDDRSLTESIIAGGKLLGIMVLDHIIIGDDSFYSFANSQVYETNNNVTPFKMATTTPLVSPPAPIQQSTPQQVAQPIRPQSTLLLTDRNKRPPEQDGYYLEWSNITSSWGYYPEFLTLHPGLKSVCNWFKRAR